MARKRKYNYNGTLLNLALLGGAAIILKKRTGKLAGIGSLKGEIVYVTEIIKIQPGKETVTLVQVWNSEDVAKRVYNNDIEYTKKYYSSGNMKISEEEITFPYLGKIHILESDKGIFITKITTQKILR